MQSLGSNIPGSKQTIKQKEDPFSENGNLKGKSFIGKSGFDDLLNKWNSRISDANHVILNHPKSKSVAQNLANKFGILTESAKSEKMTDELTKFLSLVLAQCNLANESNLSQLHEVCNDYTSVPDDYINDQLFFLDEQLPKLKDASEADGQTKSGHYSMAVVRQEFVESDIKTKFEDEDTQQ